MASKLDETRKYYALFNTLEEKKGHLAKECSLLNSINENYTKAASGAKEKIAESAVMGTYVVALCGETFPVTRSAKPGSPVCPKCKKIYGRMRKS